MPRRPRMCIPGVPNHVITRGNDHQVCFTNESDYVFYLDCLSEAIDRYDAAVHAYVLMTNHVHLLITPNKDDSIAKVMQSVGRRYVQYFNRLNRRTGTLWEGRYKSSLVNDERYVLACYRYIEFNSVRARMVRNPGSYRWSSYLFNAYGVNNELLTMYPCYLAIGGKLNRRKYYRQLFTDKQDIQIDSKIRTAGLFSTPLSSAQINE